MPFKVIVERLLYHYALWCNGDFISLGIILNSYKIFKSLFTDSVKLPLQTLKLLLIGVMVMYFSWTVLFFKNQLRNSSKYYYNFIKTLPMENFWEKIIHSIFRPIW